MYRPNYAVAVAGWLAALAAGFGLVWLIEVADVSDPGSMAAAVRHLPVGTGMYEEPAIQEQ